MAKFRPDLRRSPRPGLRPRFESKKSQTSDLRVFFCSTLGRSNGIWALLLLNNKHHGMRVHCWMRSPGRCQLSRVQVPGRLHHASTSSYHDTCPLSSCASAHSRHQYLVLTNRPRLSSFHAKYSLYSLSLALSRSKYLARSAAEWKSSTWMKERGGAIAA